MIIVSFLIRNFFDPQVRMFRKSGPTEAHDKPKMIYYHHRQTKKLENTKNFILSCASKIIALLYEK